ncbi:hypothetical protein LguiA_024520 [Lonicera macranthoides]
MEIDHFSHEHRLVLKEEEHKHGIGDDDGGDIQTFRRCNGCLDPISSSLLGGVYYSCVNNECEFFLHKLCAELPSEINHPLHPEHKLFLFEKRSCVCDGCNCSWGNFTYNCYKCDFDLDIICATLAERKIDHKSHIHPLIRFPSPQLTNCHACGTEHKGIFYQCPTCFLFIIHEDCLSLPTTVKHSHHEDHPLTLAYSLPSQYLTFWNYCDICTKDLESPYWVYYCAICRFCAHVNCATSKIEPFMSIFLPRRTSKVTLEEVEDSGSSDAIHFPVVDQSVTLISYILKGTNIVTEDETANQVFNHFSHDHPLILEVQDSDSESSSKRKLCLMNDTRVDETICDACVRPIFASPFYRCADQCNFFLHKCCAELPTKIDQHPSHPEHSLVLLPKSPTFFNLFKCRGCDLYCNGFSYTCTSCDFYLDVQCGSLPNTIKHEGHHPNHVLSLRTKISNRCNACYGVFRNRPILAYGCNSCDFVLESRCALLSHKVRHRYDEHPFTLTYNPVKYHSDEYYCDLCEVALNPKKWFYHCIDCDRSIHIKCLRPFYGSANIKYGRTLKIKSHQHPLALAPVIHRDTKLNNSFRAITEDSRCDGCRVPFFYGETFGFRSVECNFSLCYRSAKRCNYKEVTN